MKINITNGYNSNFQGINDSFRSLSGFADLGKSKLSSEVSNEFSLFDTFVHQAGEGLEATEHISLLSNLGEQAMDSLPLLSLYFKYKAPLKDFQNGDIQAGAAKSGVRLGESIFLLPYKIAWIACGAALGGIKSICGIKSENSGIGNGFLSANSFWNNVRNHLENFITSPHTFCTNIQRDRKREIIEQYDKWEKRKTEKLDDDLEFLKTINIYKLDKNHQKTLDDLASAELHIDKILNAMPPSKPIDAPELEKLHIEVNNDNISDISNHINECNQQQAEYENFYNTSIAEIENILNSKTTKQPEKEIIEKILNKIRHYYDTTLKVNKENLATVSRIVKIHEYLYKKDMVH